MSVEETPLDMNSNPPADADDKPEMLDPNTLKWGFVVGVSDDEKLYYSNIGKEKASIYALIGLAGTAIDILKYVRDRGTGMPSLQLNLTEQTMRIRELANGMSMLLNEINKEEA